MPRRRGQAILAEWVDPAGRRRSRSIRIRDAGGVRKATQQAEALEARNRRDSADVRLGLLTDDQLELRQRGATSVEAALELHLDELRRAGRTTGHRDGRALAVRAAGRGRRVAELTTDRLRRFLYRGQDGGWAPRTFNFYRGHLGAFCRWLVVQGYLPANPVERIPMVADHRQARVARALEPGEAVRLIAAAPPRRARFYRRLLLTGLRWTEAASLTGADIRDGFLTVPAHVSKNRREAVIPWPAELKRPPPELAVARAPDGRTWREDLKRAGVPFRTGDGAVYRRSLRKSFATFVQLAGVEPGVADLLMRHEGSIRQRHYLDRRQLRASMRAASDQLLAWWDGQLEAAP